MIFSACSGSSSDPADAAGETSAQAADASTTPTDTRGSDARDDTGSDVTEDTAADPDDARDVGEDTQDIEEDTQDVEEVSPEDVLEDATDTEDTTFEEGDTDWVDVMCTDPAWTPGECVAGTIREDAPDDLQLHINEPFPIEYEDDPPTWGDHRLEWGKWGEYEFLPPQRWLHNLEHGGIAILYHPCAPTETVDALRAIAQARPDDGSGFFRWVMTPYPDLQGEVAIVAWGQLYTANCVNEGEITTFINEHYDRGPEDVVGEGEYDRGWIAR